MLPVICYLRARESQQRIEVLQVLFQNSPLG